MKKKLDICIVADRSGSLEEEGEGINAALVSMLENIKREPYLSGVEIYLTLVSFAANMSKNVDFAPIEKVSPASLKLTYGGQTNPGPALDYVVYTANDRYYKWSDNGEEAFHPLIFFFTDACPYPEEKYLSDYKKIAEKIRALEANKKLVIVGIGYGNADIEKLGLITADKAHMVNITGSDPKKLDKFFKEVIPQTIKPYTTGDKKALDRLFRDLEKS